MLQCSTHLQKFIYVVVRRIEIISYTKCTKSAAMQHKTLEISE